MKLYVLLFAGWSAIATSSAHAAFFTDEEAHNQIRQLKERVFNLEGSGKQQTETIKQQADTIKQQIEIRKQQTREILDLQAQLETQKDELRRLRGQDEMQAHSLQETEKRQRDSYIDLDTRLRRFEKIEAVMPSRPIKP
ncbi:Eukaryotic translation initiation factor 3 110 kDa subunit [Candidatus Nitrotoga sp. HW29]|uniref:YbgF trimerization domain-containing protein n=1 Tax=Candidatus Nitrotoga sp. HW29 TaxID=2886963 RepID=UPI001EF39D57|nr:YbgF trimerization domain-containing protein [Candidatus Nitrotoga sp. HW29]CAH1903712.1 Eukaryotic translation initiation factor 3 110 kDa subunit [Candidatus Nitrotoga sp. HW29]